jgi:hypothetical protein
MSSNVPLMPNFVDAQKADGGTTAAWPTPRSMKVDIAVVLRACLDSYGLTEDRIPVLKNGIFQASMLVNEHGIQRPVVTVQTSADSSERIGMGNLDSVVDSHDPNLQTDLTLPANEVVYLQSIQSNVTVDVTINDLNEMRADQLYLFVKTIMLSAQQEFMNIGYVNPPLLTNGTDANGPVLTEDGGEFMLYTRVMTYVGSHRDFVAGIDALGDLIGQQFSVDPAFNPDGDAKLTADFSGP